MTISCNVLSSGLVTSSNNLKNTEFSKLTQEDLFRRTSKSSPNLSIRKVRIVLRSYQKCFLKYIEKVHYINFVIPELSIIKIYDSNINIKNVKSKQIKYDDKVLINMIKLETGEQTSIIKLIIENYYQNLISSFYIGYRANFLSLLYLRFNEENKIIASAGSKLLKMRKDNNNLKIKVYNIKEDN